MKNKTNQGNKKPIIFKGDKCFKLVSENIQSRLDKGSLKLDFKLDGKEIKVIEEFSAGVILLDEPYQLGMINRLVLNMDFSNINTLVKEEAMYNIPSYIILNAVNCVDRVHLRYLALQAFKSKHNACGEIITMVIFKALEAINGKTKLQFEYGIENCMVATILYWASLNGFIDQIYSNISPEYFGDIIITKEDTYEQLLIRTNNKFGQAYYNYKTGIIKGQEFINILVSENGKLPIPRFADLVASPEFSFQVAEEIVDHKQLQDLDYSEEVKEIISQIFQCYYTTTYSYIVSVYSFIVLGYFYKTHKDKIENSFRQVEYLKKQGESYESKIKELKSNIRALKKEIENSKEENKNLTWTIKQLEESLEHIKETGVTDIDPFIEELKQKDEAIDNLNTQVTELTRSSNKKDIIIENINRTNKELKDQIEELQDKNNDLNERLASAMVTQTNEVIPIECLVKSMREKRIAIFGGDVMHPVLKNIGFNDLRLFKANDKTIVPNQIINVDAIVIVTGYLGHATRDMFKEAAENRGVPIMYFNNMSANKLCRDLFMFLYCERK